MIGPWLRVPLVAIFALVLQASLLAELRVLDVSAELMMLLAVAAGAVGGPERGATVGFVSGLVLDLVLSTPFGTSALAYTLLGYGVGIVQGSILRTSWWVPLVTAAVGSAVGMLLYVLIAASVGEVPLFEARLGTIMVVVGMLNGLLAAAVVPVVRWALTSAPAKAYVAR